MELSLSHTLHLFNIFREYDGKDNCAQVLEEEISKFFSTKSLNDEHVNFCGVHVCMNTPNREDIYCKRHKHLETKWLQEARCEC